MVVVSLYPHSAPVLGKTGSEVHRSISSHESHSAWFHFTDQSLPGLAALTTTSARDGSSWKDQSLLKDQRFDTICTSRFLQNVCLPFALFWISFRTSHLFSSSLVIATWHLMIRHLFYTEEKLAMKGANPAPPLPDVHAPHVPLVAGHERHLTQTWLNYSTFW